MIPCLLLANGLAGNPEITEKNSDYMAFCKALNYINETLAKKMAGDGEGCTALFEVTVDRALPRKTRPGSWPNPSSPPV